MEGDILAAVTVGSIFDPRVIHSSPASGAGRSLNGIPYKRQAPASVPIVPGQPRVQARGGDSVVTNVSISIEREVAANKC